MTQDGKHLYGPGPDYNPTAIYHRTLPLPAGFRASGYDPVFLHLGAVSDPSPPPLSPSLSPRLTACRDVRD